MEDRGSTRINREYIGSGPPLLYKEDWHQMKGRYKPAVDNLPPPARVTLEQITLEQVDLYRQVQPPGENTPISVDPWTRYLLRTR